MIGQSLSNTNETYYSVRIAKIYNLNKALVPITKHVYKYILTSKTHKQIWNPTISLERVFSSSGKENSCVPNQEFFLHRYMPFVIRVHFLSTNKETQNRVTAKHKLHYQKKHVAQARSLLPRKVRFWTNFILTVDGFLTSYTHRM